MTGTISRGDLIYADLSPTIGYEQGGIRPVVVIQNDVGNRYSPTVIVAAITSQINMAKLPTHVEISANEYSLNKDSVVILEQIRTLDKRRLKDKIGKLTFEDMMKVDIALTIILELRGRVGEPYTVYKDNEEARIFKEVNKAVSILKGISKKYDIDEYFTDNEWGEKCENLFKQLINGFEDLDSKVSPLVEKQKIAKGKLNEHAVVAYFQSKDYEANRSDSVLDALKIDVIAKDEKHKIFTQVKLGQISSKEITKLVENVKHLDASYDELGMSRVACVCADTFPPDSDMLRMRLEQEFEIPIMYIHKYQILKLCPEYKSTVS